jgi:hypothetical protein
MALIHYFVDNTLKALLFDTLSVYPIKKALGEPMPSVSKASLLFTVAHISYDIRTFFREIEHQYIGGCLGNAMKYNLRALPDPFAVSKIALGCLNGAAYEYSNDIQNVTKVGELITPALIEGSEELITSSLKLDWENLIPKAEIGARIGFFISFIAETSYVPAVNILHGMLFHEDEKGNLGQEDVLEISYDNQTCLASHSFSA